LTRALKRYFNLLALDGLSKRSFEDIREAGYDGVQFALPASKSDLRICRSLGLEIAASGRINQFEDTNPLAEQWAGDGFVCATLHAGWGLENDAEAFRLIESVLAASSVHKISLYLETHRATIFQDMWRTVQFVRQFPEIRFNGDFSHWYTGQEMVYGGFEKKFEFIRPVLERVRFIHGRIGNPGCIQVRIDPGQAPEPEYVVHFRQLWTTCFRNGARTFTPELLAPGIYYARMLRNNDGTIVEESDRWEQSLVLRRIAEECFRDSQTQSA
jgi:hypothetical protein